MPRPQHFLRPAIRAAARIHEHLLGPARLPQLPALPASTWQQLIRKVEQFEEARRRHWQTAGRNVQIDLSYCVRRFERELEEYRSLLPPVGRLPRVACHRDVAADLTALHCEFQQVAIDLRERTITAVTAPICLEDLNLGPFEIVLHWQRIGQQRAYFTRALEPCRPQQEEEVTHPHVRKDVLCEGDGAAAIKAALAEGRLLDFFTLVKQVLETYNEASAYVPVSRWSGIPCADCGHALDEESHGICERCDSALCGECSTLCSGCDRYVCASCHCECSGCGDRYCRSCLTDGPLTTLYCETCLEKQGNDSDNELPAADPTESPPAVDPLCLGEAAVPA